MRLPHPQLFAIVFVLCLAAPAEAEPTVNVHVDSYSITGTTGAGIMKQINRKGPRHGFLARAIAQTQYSLDFGYEAARSADRCRVVSAWVKLDIAYVYPKLESRIPAALQRRWKRFLQGVRAHEERHGALAIEMAKATEKSIAGMSAKADERCDGLERAVKREAQRIFDRYEAEQRRYDREEHRKGGNVDRIVEALVR